jgi:hypothetical protein
MATSKSSPTAGETADATSDVPSADAQTIFTEPTSETTSVDAPVEPAVEPAPEKAPEPDTFGVVDEKLGRPRVVDMTGLRYLGFADERRIAVVDLKSIGADHDEDLVWYGKGYVLPKDGLSAQTIDALNSLDEFEAI